MLTRFVIVSVNGGGYHLWEVTQDELVRFKMVRLGDLRTVLGKKKKKRLTAIANRHTTPQRSHTR